MSGLRHLVPAFDGGDDFVGIGGPCEGLWHLVCLGEEAVDSGLEIDDGSEDPALQSPPGQFGEEAFDGVEPRTRGFYNRGHLECPDWAGRDHSAAS